MKSSVKAILKMFLRYPWRVGLGIACLLLVDAGQLAIPLVVGRAVDGVAALGVSVAWVAGQAFLLVAIAVLVACFRFAWRHFFFSTGRLAEVELRQRIFSHALALSATEFSRTPAGEIMALCTNDVEAVRQAIAMGFVAGFDASVYTVAAIAAMFFLDPELALLSILPLPLLALLMKVALRAVYDRWDKVQASFETLTEKTRESVAGVRVLKAYVQHEGNTREFNAASEDYFRKYLRYVRIDALFHPVILLLAGSCLAILLGVGGARVIAGDTSVGVFVSLTAYLGMLTWPMIAAGWMFTLVQRAAASMDRISRFLAKTSQSSANSDEPFSFEGELRVRNLTFRYPGNTMPALQELELSLPAGRSLGVVGEIGSGKSSLAHLLCRFYDPPAGTITLDGRDICDLDLDNLRATIALVPQEAFLFSDTIAANLRFGNPDATPADLERICRKVALHGEIVKFPEGYETLLGERGVTLSGGQKQRLCLARALLKNAPILLLDDTLSAVDSETERRILVGLQDELGRRTTVVIGHRVSAVAGLDQILVLKGGRVVQRGTHAELACEQGMYRRMIELQEMEG